MEKNLEVMKQSLVLSETVLEGLTHLLKQLGEHKHSEAILLMNDVMMGIVSIENSVQPIFEKIADSVAVQEHLEQLHESMDNVVTALEQQSYETVEEHLQRSLIPQFEQVKNELETIFGPYLMS